MLLESTEAAKVSYRGMVTAVEHAEEVWRMRPTEIDGCRMKGESPSLSEGPLGISRSNAQLQSGCSPLPLHTENLMVTALGLAAENNTYTT